MTAADPLPARPVRQRNGFDTLRLLGALVVLVGHSIIVTGGVPIHLGTIPLHSFGVCVFFTISGFLITQSWLADGNPVRYMMRRALRIFPALFVVVTVTALVIGPIATTEPLATYFARGWTYRYIVSNSALLTSWSLPGVFEHLPLATQANGSLWTLPIEFALYLLVPALVFAFRLAGRKAAYALLIASVATVAAGHVAHDLFNANLFGIEVGWGLGIAPFFWIGAALRLLDFAAWRPAAARTAFLASATMTIAWMILSPFWPEMTIIGVVPLAVIILSLGLRDWLHLAVIERVGDLSYGLYLWGFPLQQLILDRIGGGAAVNLVLALPITSACAYVSWHLIERPALRFKPRRRARPAAEREPVDADAALQSPGLSQ